VRVSISAVLAEIHAGCCREELGSMRTLRLPRDDNPE
jgi:hypothetical protein